MVPQSLPAPARGRAAAALAAVLAVSGLLPWMAGCGDPGPSEDDPYGDEFDDGDEPEEGEAVEPLRTDPTAPQHGRAAAPDDPAQPPRPTPPPKPAPPLPARLVEPAPRPVPKGAPQPADEVARRIEELHPKAAAEPAAPLPGEPEAVRVEKVRARAAWEKDLDAIAGAADAYLQSVGTEGGDPRVLWWAGQGKALWANRQAPPEALRGRMDAEELLLRAVGSAPPDAGWSADALLWLGRTRLFLVEAGRASLEETVENLRDAAIRLTAAGRTEEAGTAVAQALAKLVAAGDDARALELGTAVNASGTDYGPGLNGVVARFLMRAETGVGSSLPELPQLSDGEGRPFDWGSLTGKPFVLHFFAAGLSTGKPAEQRDVATFLKPLHERLHPRGLEMVGVSMDLALTPEREREIVANWDEWGVKGKVQNGSRDSVRRWVEDQGLAWTWLWDGKWSQNPVSVRLGGAGVSGAHAILVDREGVIRWRGDAPFEGLDRAAEDVLK